MCLGHTSIRLPLSFSNINLSTFHCDFEQNLLNSWLAVKKSLKKKKEKKKIKEYFTLLKLKKTCQQFGGYRRYWEPKSAPNLHDEKSFGRYKLQRTFGTT